MVCVRHHYGGTGRWPRSRAVARGSADPRSNEPDYGGPVSVPIKIEGQKRDLNGEDRPFKYDLSTKEIRTAR